MNTEAMDQTTFDKLEIGSKFYFAQSPYAACFKVDGSLWVCPDKKDTVWDAARLRNPEKVEVFSAQLTAELPKLLIERARIWVAKGRHR